MTQFPPSGISRLSPPTALASPTKISCLSTCQSRSIKHSAAWQERAIEWLRLVIYGGEDVAGHPVFLVLLEDGFSPEAGGLDFVGESEVNAAGESELDDLLVSALTGRQFLEDFLGVGKPAIGIRKRVGVFLAAAQEHSAEAKIEGEVIRRILDGELDFLFGV